MSKPSAFGRALGAKFPRLRLGDPGIAGARVLTTVEAAKWLGLSPRTLEKWRVTGQGPRYRKFGRSVRYAISDLETFLIDVAVAKNPDLLNVKGTRRAEWSITGVVRAKKGKPSESATTFKAALGI